MVKYRITKIYTKPILISSLFLISCFLPTIPGLDLFTNEKHFLNAQHQNQSEKIDMLIFISPQYSRDKEIRSAINDYIFSVKKDINWNAKTILLNNSNNNFLIIDNIIEEYFLSYPLKACIMVGEDTSTALGGQNNYMTKPSIIPWTTTGGNNSYEISENGIICKPYKYDICISLIYPTNAIDYNTKKTHIINSFSKFSNDRNISYNKKIQIFESSEINNNSKELYDELSIYKGYNYTQDPELKEIINSLNEFYSFYAIHGHSNPSGTLLNKNNNSWFKSDFINSVKSPIFFADGCYVNGWWTNTNNKNMTVSPSIDAPWFGSSIFTSCFIRTMILGLLSQDGYVNQLNVFENTISELLEGKTIAESFIGNTFSGDIIIIGDPTFHFAEPFN